MSQDPQRAGVVSEVSQSGLLVSQLPKPVLHTGVEHLVPSHDDVALAKLQELPQRPQLVAESSRVSHPGSLVQSPNPALQAPATHWPSTQVASALANVQVLPHSPQLFLSVFTSTHLLLHLVAAVAGHSETHDCLPAAEEQNAVMPLQTVVQVPQWASVVRAVSQSALAVSQFP
jgi:hypothetical protein